MTTRGAIESISAVTLVTADMARSFGFYDALGFERLAGGPASPFTTFRVGTSFLNIQLDPAHAPVARIWGRPIFYVDDVDAIYQRALEAGITPSMPPSDAPWNERYFHVLDPDGHELSFARPLPPRDDRAPSDAHELVPAFATTITTSDADLMASLYHLDAVYFLPSLGIGARGRLAIRDQWARTFEQWRAISFVVDDHDLDVNNDLASSWMRATLTVEWHATGQREDLSVRAADVFARGLDGRWRYAVDHA